MLRQGGAAASQASGRKMTRITPVHSIGIRLLALLAALWVGALACSVAFAETAPGQLDPGKITKEVSAVASAMKADTHATGTTLKQWDRQLADLENKAESCADNAQRQVDTLNEGLTKLGPESSGASTTAKRTRKALLDQKDSSEQRLTTCRAVSVNAHNLHDEVRRLNGIRLARALFTQGPDVIDVAHIALTQAANWSRAAATELLSRSGIDLFTPGVVALLAVVLALAAALGLRVRWRLRTWAQRWTHSEKARSAFGMAVIATGARYSLALSVSVAMAIFFYRLTVDEKAIPFIAVIAFGLPAVLGLVMLIRVLLNPPKPAQLYLDLEPETARALARRLRVLVWVVYVGYLVLATLFARSLPSDLILAARAVFAPVLVINLVWATWLLGRIPPMSRTRMLRFFIIASFPVALGCEWLGYRTLAEAILRVVLGTLIIAGAGLLLHRLVQEAFDGLNEGHRRWHRWVRRTVGARPGDPLPGSLWLRAITTLALWGGCAYLLLANLGLSAAAMAQVRQFLINGFSVGSLTINPARIAFALALFGIMLSVIGWVRARLSTGWLSRTRMERGARESVVTMTGYAGVAIALVIALSVAGFSFTNLAIIAGALSVGIGFGLQNIVNNFVSGLILLFERPIRTGDWIVVGNTEGYVKRISIRATQLQTFDQADVVVPNSELISNQVTNWMLHDARGRVIVPVGVAYGSDTKKVKDILLEAAKNHGEVVTDGTSPAPTVLFRQFGDSSLDFEVRCFIRQVDMRLQVISDLNFAIDAAFRREGVEIPFPQRDLHVRDYPRQGGDGKPQTGLDPGEPQGDHEEPDQPDAT